jgi:hypothetical protein
LWEEATISPMLKAKKVVVTFTKKRLLWDCSITAVGGQYSANTASKNI